MSNTYSVSNVNVGTTANDGQGDPLRAAFVKINQNFANVYAYANLAYYNGQGGGGANIYNNTFTNVTYYNNTTANLAGYVSLTLLNSELANVRAIDLTGLNNVLANVNFQLGILDNKIANVSVVDLGDVTNALANISNITSLGNLGNIIGSIAANANAVARVSLVSNLSANGTANGQQVYNTTDGGLYIWQGNAWISPGAAYTPTATSISGVEIFSTFSFPSGPGDGRDFNGRQGFYNNKLYIYTSNAWNLYDTYIAGSGNVSLAPNTITSAMIVAGAITAGKIGAAAISATEIAAGAITANLLASNSIIAGKIAAGVISATEIAANAITADKIGASSIYAGAIQANAITAGKIAASAIFANNIAAYQITAGKIAANAITATEIAANSIYAYQLTANSVTANSIATNSIYANAIQASAITADKIAANAITAVKVAANSIYGNAIMFGTLTGNAIAANSITVAQIDTRGLTIRDSNGNILISAGYISGNIPVAVAGGGTTTLENIASNVTATAKWLDLTNDFPGFGVSGGTYTNTSNITLTANLQGMSGTVTFSVTNGSATLTSTADPNVKKLLFTDMATDSVTIKATFVDGSDTYDDIVSLYKVYNGNTTPLMYLTDENRTLPADSSGTVSSFSGVSTQATIYEGLYDVSSSWTYATTASGCTISGTNTRNVTVTAMSADTATVTFVASRSGYANLTRVYKLSKAKQGPQGTAGANGANGTNGTRGQIRTSAIRSAGTWSDSAATAAIAAAGGGSPITTDEVTLYYNPSSYAETKVWDGSTWSSVVASFNGSILINGTVIASKIATGAVTADKVDAGAITAGKIATGAITADKIQAGAITADKISASSATIASTGTFGFGAGTNVQGYGAVGAFEATSASKFGLIGATSTTEPGIVAASRSTSTTSGSALAFFRMKNGTYSGGTTNLYSSGILGSTSQAGGFAVYNGGGTENSSVNLASYGVAAVAATQRDFLGTQVASIQVGTATGYAAYSYLGAYGPFTGSHDALIDKTIIFEIGDIVVDYELINKLSVNDIITKVVLSSAPNQKSVLGVISANIGNTVEENGVPTALAEYDPESDSFKISSTHQTVYDAHDVLSINSLGEGCINVCGENGDIEMGDYITTSSMLGKGMKQTDDLLHNYTVAKARENVTFSSPTEVKQIACSYHCG